MVRTSDINYCKTAQSRLSTDDSGAGYAIESQPASIERQAKFGYQRLHTTKLLRTITVRQLGLQTFFEYSLISKGQSVA